MTAYDGQSETGKIAGVLMKSPRAAWLSQENVDARWRRLLYPERPDYDRGGVKGEA